MIHSS